MNLKTTPITNEDEAIVANTLDPYTGDWTFAEASHLLRRTTFGCTPTQVEEAVELGLESTLDLLFSDLPMPAPPINYNFNDDPNVPIGETWVNAAYINSPGVINYRSRSLVGWHVQLMLEEGISIREKLTLFWHNHFAIANVNDPKFIYRYISLIRENTWGNFREFVKKMTIEPAMLRFLNGNQNTKESPNENFARELLELYTIGKGPLTGPGDYTNYTEDDVREVAKALTGWRDAGYLSPLSEIEVSSFFRPVRHDASTKQLSHRFGEAVISNSGDQEYKNVVDVICQQPEVARFICRKLYRWFIYYQIDDTVEANIIEPLAQILIDNDFEIKPTLKILLGSEHFFDILNRGPMIKNPYDFSLGLFKQNAISLPIEDLTTYYDFSILLYSYIATMEMDYFSPPSVSGWKAYYQEPAYYRVWINSSTLRPRMLLTDVFATIGFRLPRQSNTMKVDVFEMIEQIERAYDPNEMIKELAARFFPQPLAEDQLTNLKEVLIPGLPDFEWTVEYNLYLEDPNNNEIRASVESKLRTLLQHMLSMPEYYLS